MALTWTAKPADAVYRLTWTVPLIDGDSIDTATLTVSSGDAAIDAYEIVDDGVVAFVSGGTAGTYTTIAAEAVTADGETIPETIYLPVISSATALGYTGLDLAHYVLRKVVGNGETPSADELNDCLERLSDMLAAWKGQGAETGIPLPLASASLIRCDDAFIQAIKANGILRISDLYDNYNLSPVVVEEARRGLQLIKSRNLPAERGAVVFY